MKHRNMIFASLILNISVTSLVLILVRFASAKIFHEWIAYGGLVFLGGLFTRFLILKYHDQPSGVGDVEWPRIAMVLQATPAALALTSCLGVYMGLSDSLVWAFLLSPYLIGTGVIKVFYVYS